MTLKEKMGNKSFAWTLFSAFIVFSFVCASWVSAAELDIAGDDWQVADGGLSMDPQNEGIFAATGTGVVNEGVTLNVSIGTGGAYFTTEQSIRPVVSMDSTGYVDVYAAGVVADLVVYFNLCTGDMDVNGPVPCRTDSLDTEMFSFPALWLTQLFPGMTYVPFGAFVRVVEPGTGPHGTVLADQSATTYIADLPPMPEPAQSPW